MPSVYQPSMQEAIEKAYNISGRSLSIGAFGDWTNAVITIATDDDLTAAVDLGSIYDYMMVYVPTIDSANLSLYAAETSTSTYYRVGLATNIVAAGTGGFIDCWQLGGLRYIKIMTSAAQTANRTFRVQGVRI